MEHECRKSCAGVPSFFGLGVGGGLCSNVLASTVSAFEAFEALLWVLEASPGQASTMVTA